MSSTSPYQQTRALCPLLLTSLALVVALGSQPLPVFAQDVTGALQGYVVSPEGAPEPDVHITVAGPHLQGTRAMVTDGDGFYQFLVLPPGMYELRVGRIGSRPIVVRDIVVELGRTTGVATLTLTTQAIEMAPVAVIAPPASLDPVRTTVGGVIRAEDYAALPVDRDYKSIVTILPHANESYRGDPVNVGGATGLENQYYIDGVNVTDSKLSNRATGLPYNFVRNVTVKTGGYEARYGRALGAVVDAVTYSGTNTLEVNAFGITRPTSLAADPKAAPVVREGHSSNYEFGGRVSGPIVRDRLWYSAAVNPELSRIDKELVGYGYFRDENSTVHFASKLTYRATSTTTLELSVFGDPSTQDRVDAPPGFISTLANPDPLLSRVTSGGNVASIRGTAEPSKSLLLQASVARQWDRYSIAAATPRGRAEFYYWDLVNNALHGGLQTTISEDRGRTSLSLQGMLTLSRHTLMAGVDYQDLKTTSEYDSKTIIRTDSTRWELFWESYGGQFDNRSAAGYLQDTWRVADRIALNAGLRWSQQQMIGESRRTAQRFNAEWQPRIGLSWTLGNSNAHRLFGSYGRFFQTLPTNLAVVWYVDYGGGVSVYSTDPRLPGAVPDEMQDWSLPESSAPLNLPGVAAENHDEFTAGYERCFGGGSTVTVRGIHRNLRSSFQWGYDPSSTGQPFVLGTPGEGAFGFLPAAKRRYTALEFAAEGTIRRLRYRASYVLSRSWGNYPGLYGSDLGLANPGGVFTFYAPHQAINSTGFLPNDHPHVLKLSSSYDTVIGLTLGGLLSVESGSPINDFAIGPGYFPDWPSFVTQRGTAGRTPALWNLDLRLAYALPWTRSLGARLQLDILHVGNPQGTVRVNEWHYLALDGSGQPTSPNSDYMKPTSYQPPMAVRLGVEINL